MPTTVQFRRGTTAQNEAFTGAAGEITFDTEKQTLRVHDAATAGGSTLLSSGGATQSIESSTTATPDFTFKNTTDDATGPVLRLESDRATPADNDVAGTIEFKASDDAGAQVLTASILSKITDVSNGSEDGNIEFAVHAAGSSTTIATVDATGVTINSGILVATTGSTVGNLTLANGSITDSGGSISFGDENLTTTGTITAATGSSIGNLTLADGSITDSSGAISFDNENLTTTGSITAGTSFIIGSADINETDLEKLDGITNGTVSASKAVVVDASSDITGFRNVTATGSFIIGSASMNETDLEKLDGITDGTAAANKALVLDASSNITGINSLLSTTIRTNTIQSDDSTLVNVNDGLRVEGALNVQGGAEVYGTFYAQQIGAEDSTQLTFIDDIQVNGTSSTINDLTIATNNVDTVTLSTQGNEDLTINADSGSVIVTASETDFTANVTINGNLTVNGTEFINNTTNLEIEDNQIVIARNNSADAVDIAIFGHNYPAGFDSTVPNHTGIFRDATNAEWYLVNTYSKNENQNTIDRTDPSFSLANFNVSKLTFADLSDGTITISAFVDEDNMASNSATLVPTQQSVKAYVDAQDANIASDTLTFTNKTFDANGTGNSITNIDSGNFLSGFFKDEDNMASNSATSVASQQSIKAYVDTAIGALSSTTLTEGNSSLTIADSGTGTLTLTLDAATHTTFNSSGITLSTGNFVGNASTATTLQTARTIGGVSFNGSANINLPGVNTTGNQDTTGTATNATNFNVAADNTTNATHYVIFTGGATGNQRPNSDTNLTYNPSTNVLGTTASSARYADLAERYSADAEYEPGTVMSFGGDQEITQSTLSHDPRVAGVVSTAPAYLMNADLENGTALALQGRTPVKVIGRIHKGDMLVASQTPGVACALDSSFYAPGCVIGKALASYDSQSVGTIEVVVGRI